MRPARCVNYGERWGFGYLVVANLFALRSTDPAKLYTHKDPIGPQNNACILNAAMRATTVLCAWGNHGIFKGRGQDIANRLRCIGAETVALKLNTGGAPAHPLYQMAELEPMRWTP